MSETNAPSRSLFRRDFLLLWQGDAVSALGGQAYAVALMLWAKQATESGTLVGLIMFAGGITNLLMPLGGVLADRYSRKRLLVVLDLLSGLFVLLLAALFCLLPTGHVALIPVVILLNMARGLCMALFHPVAAALLPDLVDEESLTIANSWMQTTQRVATLLGQSLGGLLFRLLGAPLLLCADGLSFVASAISEGLIREPARTPATSAKTVWSIRSELLDGLKFTGKLRGLRLYLLESSCANFCIASLFITLPFYVEDVLRAPVDWYGYLLGSMGFGAVAGAFIARRFSQPGNVRGLLQLAAIVCINGCMLPLSLVRSPTSALLIVMFAWTCVGFHQVLLSTIVQRRTPREIRGRVLGLLHMIRTGLFPLGMAAFGLIIDLVAGSVADVLFWTGVTGIAIVLAAMTQSDFRWFFTGDEQQVPL